jgi:hypothetical protein
MLPFYFRSSLEITQFYRTFLENPHVPNTKLSVSLL